MSKALFVHKYQTIQSGIYALLKCEFTGRHFAQKCEVCN